NVNVIRQREWRPIERYWCDADFLHCLAVNISYDRAGRNMDLKTGNQRSRDDGLACRGRWDTDFMGRVEPRHPYRESERVRLVGLDSNARFEHAVRLCRRAGCVAVDDQDSMVWLNVLDQEAAGLVGAGCLVPNLHRDVGQGLAIQGQGLACQRGYAGR